MKAVRVHEFGDADMLRYEDVAVPEPGEGQVQLRMEAVGVNFIDIYHRTGAYPGQPPIIPGMEGAGVVEAVGPSVTAVQPGDRVAYAMQQGAYAECAIVDARKLVPVPDDITLEQAAAVMLQGMTAHYLVHSTFPLQLGHTALIHAGAGGVGHLLVQMAKLRGARIIATTSTEEKAELVRQTGADEVILYTQADFEAETKRLTKDRGVDVVYDSVGKTTFEQSLNCLRPRGMMVLYGQASGAVPPLDPQILNRKGSLFLTRPSLGHYTLTREETLERAGQLFDWMRDDKLEVRIDRRFPLAEAAEAQRYMEGRKTKGKLLLIP